MKISAKNVKSYDKVRQSKRLLIGQHHTDTHSDFNRATSYRCVVILKNKIKIKTRRKNINEIMLICHKGTAVCRIILQPIKQEHREF